MHTPDTGKQAQQTPPCTGSLKFAPYTPSPLGHGVTPSPLGSGTSSAPPTPVKGLSMEEVKSMGKMWTSPAKFIEIIRIPISMYTGDEADEEKLMELLSTLLEINVKFSPFQSV
jgi:hypothetical protein